MSTTAPSSFFVTPSSSTSNLHVSDLLLKSRVRLTDEHRLLLKQIHETVLLKVFKVLKLFFLKVKSDLLTPTKNSPAVSLVTVNEPPPARDYYTYCSSLSLCLIVTPTLS
ncbi:heat shock protein 90-2 [Pyrus ussuriensis x Pyrus communis]|uniref:Heat shock protein 90-2 n=1 Tax=Pyrus ussuriensis x Pyrus communis TaxID=2448454 RepID=A0A5N5FWI5_9ROSA|nr:heat shock protein 90-2 [Pyrus ussuriensis x Pyrus communis]